MVLAGVQASAAAPRSAADRSADALNARELARVRGARWPVVGGAPPGREVAWLGAPLMVQSLMEPERLQRGR